MYDISKTHESLIDQIKTLDTKELKDLVDDRVFTKIIEEQKIYFWIRLYLKDDNINAEIGDDIKILHTPTGEVLVTKFICYDKIGIEKDHGHQVTNYSGEDNKKVMCLMIDTKMVNFNDDVKFIRSLFKTGYHYQYQLMRRDELQFIIVRNSLIIDYFDVDF